MKFISLLLYLFSVRQAQVGAPVPEALIILSY